MIRDEKEMQQAVEVTVLTKENIPNADALFMIRVTEVIENNIASPGFGVKALCGEINMSRMHLHRRLHEIIGKSASELIRDIRMKKAARLLENKLLRITEVMQETGISNYNLFNKHFKAVYGKTPKRYMKRS